MIRIAPAEKDAATATLEEPLWEAADQFPANSGLKSPCNLFTTTLLKELLKNVFDMWIWMLIAVVGVGLLLADWRRWT